jgi:hypothetical protein
MYIDKFIVSIKDAFSKRNKNVAISADSVHDAHYKALAQYNELTQDIVKITNYEKEVVYTLERGFTY